MNKTERLNKAFEYLRYEGVVKTREDVAQAMKSTRQNVSSALKGNNKVLTDNFLMRFANTFRQISLSWLLNEEGEMLAVVTPEWKSENTPQVLEGDADKDVIEEQAKMTARIMELMRETSHIPKTFALEANIEMSLFLLKLKGEKVWSVADVHKICDTFKVRKGWLVDGEGPRYRLPNEVLENIPARRSFDAGVPYYNVAFELGFDFMGNDQTINPEFMIDCQPYNKCDAWCCTRGDSMHPTISGGDIIALKEVRDPKSCLINGEIYAIVTTNELRTIKRVKDNGETVTLIPDNKAVPEQTIDKNLLDKVYRVMGCMKMW